MNGITVQTRYALPLTALKLTRDLLAEPGRRGLEAAVLWSGRLIGPDAALVTDVHRPEQVARVTPWGLSVELTEGGLTALIASLAPDEIILARLHTHGNDDTYHSEVDDRNLVVGHPGAVSIVVPNFAVGPIALERCGVHVLSQRHHWYRLPAAETKARFSIT